MKNYGKVVNVIDNNGKVIGQREIPRPYMIYDNKNGDVFQEFYGTQELCNSIALEEWCRMSDYDKEQRNEYYTAKIKAVDEECFPVEWDILNKVV